MAVTRFWSASLGILLVTFLAVAFASGAGAYGAAPVAGTLGPGKCPVTEPNGKAPSNLNEGDYPGGYGNDALWTNVWMWREGGVLLPASVQNDGSIAELKWSRSRYVPGKLTIEGRRLDGPAPPPIAHVPDGYGDTGFQVSGITFPTQGCWEVTGWVGTESLIFVVWVEVYDPFATPFASPEAQR